MAGLHEAGRLAEAVGRKVAELTAERNALREELSVRSSANIARDKEYVRKCLAGVVEAYAATQRATRLERILLVR